MGYHVRGQLSVTVSSLVLPLEYCGRLKSLTPKSLSLVRRLVIAINAKRKNYDNLTNGNTLSWNFKLLTRLGGGEGVVMCWGLCKTDSLYLRDWYKHRETCNIDLFPLLQPCQGKDQSRMSCTAPPIELSNSSNTFRIGLLMDAACQLLTLPDTIRVRNDPYFEPFKDPVIFDETESLDSSLKISIEVSLPLEVSIPLYVEIICCY